MSRVLVLICQKKKEGFPGTGKLRDNGKKDLLNNKAITPDTENLANYPNLERSWILEKLLLPQTTF